MWLFKCVIVKEITKERVKSFTKHNDKTAYFEVRTREATESVAHRASAVRPFGQRDISTTKWSAGYLVHYTYMEKSNTTYCIQAILPYELKPPLANRDSSETIRDTISLVKSWSSAPWFSGGPKSPWMASDIRHKSVCERNVLSTP